MLHGPCYRYSIWVLCKCRTSMFVMKTVSMNHTLFTWGIKWISIRTSDVSWLLWVNFRIEGLYVTLLSNWVLRKDRCSDGHAILKDVNETSHLFSTFLVLFWKKKWYRNNLQYVIKYCKFRRGRSRWPRRLRRRSAAARLLRSWVRIPPGA